MKMEHQSLEGFMIAPLLQQHTNSTAYQKYMFENYYDMGAGLDSLKRKVKKRISFGIQMSILINITPK